MNQTMIDGAAASESEDLRWLLSSEAYCQGVALRAAAVKQSRVVADRQRPMALNPSASFELSSRSPAFGRNA